MPASEYRPQLATLVKQPPSGDQWVHELKYDGYRIGCRIRRGSVALYSRNGNEWTARFPEIVDAAKALRTTDALIDGEVCMVLSDGRTSFQALQQAFAAGRGRDSLTYFVFDLLRLDGERIERRPLEERKARLKRLVSGRQIKARIRYADHVVGNGEAFFRQACRHGLEGMISKRGDQPYRAGRHGDWVKTKCTLGQEFVIGGFTEPEGARVGIGALLVGYHDREGRLIYSGKVGTGFAHRLALDLRKKLEGLEQPTPPFATSPKGVGRNVHWVRPQLVGEVAFTEWTSDGKIRHPSFQGLRADKKPREVIRERPATSGLASAAVEKTSSGRDVVCGVRITHADRVIYPELGLTKLDLARYYESIADWIVPHVKDRPLTLVRCPEGLRAECFYMKHARVWAPAPVRRVRIQEKKKLGEYLIASDIGGVIGLVQMGVLEIHTWNTVIEKVEHPDRLVFDLDPGEGVPWARLVRSARLVRDALGALGLESFVKTTGGAGLHVVVPLVPHADWAACLEFARAVAERIERADPGTYTTKFAKVGRAKQILIDYLRNNRTNTSIAAFSTRASPPAPVSVPLTWAELRASLDPASFTVRTIPRRLARLRDDPWRGYWTSRQKLTRQILKAVEVEL